MHPILFHLGRRSFYSYGLLAVLAMIAGGYVVERLFRRHCMDSSTALEMTVAAIVGGPTYTDASLRRAITTGVDPEGGQLAWPMPQWQLTGQEWGGLLAYLKTLH